MKQKIIIKVSMHCSKCRKRALKIAALAEGVTSVALHGPEKDKLMIVGEEIDAACLTNSLKKKLCHASIETVEEVKEAKKGDTQSKDKKDTEDKKDKKEPPKSTPKDQVIYCCPQQPQLEYYAVVSDPSPPLCTIL